MIGVVQEQVGRWSMSAVVFAKERRRVPLPVHAIIGNSVPTSASGKAVLLNWKRTVAAAAQQARGGAPLDSRRVYCVSAGFSFHMPSHGNQGLEVENFLKPTFDGLAAGLFCEPTTDCMQLDRFAYDDTGFRYLFVYRLPDAPSVADEGVGFVVSIQEAGPRNAQPAAGASGHGLDISRCSGTRPPTAPTAQRHCVRRPPRTRSCMTYY